MSEYTVIGFYGLWAGNKARTEVLPLAITHMLYRLHCKFLCLVLKALIFTKLRLKLSYFLKQKSRIFRRWGFAPYPQ